MAIVVDGRMICDRVALSDRVPPENRRLCSRLFVHYVGVVPHSNCLHLRLTQ
jgi:hypothetical protein